MAAGNTSTRSYLAPQARPSFASFPPLFHNESSRKTVELPSLEGKTAGSKSKRLPTAFKS